MKKVFIVEDNSVLVANISEIFADTYEIMSADLEQGMDFILNQIKDFEPDVVLLDHFLESSFYGSDIRKYISGMRVVSISSEKQDYCDEHWGKKMSFWRQRYMSIQVINELKEVIERS
jgi:chemotaxis response regulator CheB